MGSDLTVARRELADRIDEIVAGLDLDIAEPPVPSIGTAIVDRLCATVQGRKAVTGLAGELFGQGLADALQAGADAIRAKLATPKAQP